MMEVMRIMQNQVRKKDTKLLLLKDKQKELEFMNAMISDRLALAQRRRFGSSSEKYADGYEQMKEEFLKSRYIHCDETRIQVIDEPNQKGSSQNWMWVYLTDRYSEAPQMVRNIRFPVKQKNAWVRTSLTCALPYHLLQKG